jgi:hypothetical protein
MKLNERGMFFKPFLHLNSELVREIWKFDALLAGLEMGVDAGRRHLPS